MKSLMIKTILLNTLFISTTSCYRQVRTAIDITPNHSPCDKLDWRYGAADIRIQTSHLTRQIFDRWELKTGYSCPGVRPRILITEIDNCTDQYISTEMIREIIEGVAIDDGRFTVVVGNSLDEGELDHLIGKINCHPKYHNPSRLQAGQAIAPEFLGKIRITKAIREDRFYLYEDYRMGITLYDIETQEAIDSAWDVLCKKVRR